MKDEEMIKVSVQSVVAIDRNEFITKATKSAFDKEPKYKIGDVAYHKSWAGIISPCVIVGLFPKFKSDWYYLIMVPRGMDGAFAQEEVVERNLMEKAQ